MKWDKLSELEDKKFRRLTGMHRGVFIEMLNCIKQAKRSVRKHPTKGISTSLSIENQLLMVIMYWREYRDQYHIAIDYGVSQSTVSRTIRSIEDILIKSGQFSVPGRKSLSTPDAEVEVVIVDVTESPIERPKKNKSVSTAEKRSDIP